MQPGGAYVEQIPPGAKPPTGSTTPLRIVPNTTPVVSQAPPPGLYVQIASVLTQEQAVRTGLEFAQRLGAKRPPFIRGEAVMVEGQRRIRLYAGPLIDVTRALSFCALAMPNQSCLMRVFVSGGSN